MGDIKINDVNRKTWKKSLAFFYLLLVCQQENLRNKIFGLAAVKIF
jgi:hypothetical protein